MNNDSKAIADIDKVIQAFFAVFDNRQGNIPDFGEFGCLFFDCSMVYKREGNSVRPMGLDEFIGPRDAMLTDGTLQDFYQWEIESQTLVNGGIATRVCRYGKSGLLNGKPYSGQGNKHIQLALTHDGWKITSVVWQDDL